MGEINESYNLQSPLKVKIDWCRQTDTPPITLSISALLLNKETNLVDKLEDFVFYGTPSHDGKKISTKDGEVKCDSLNFKTGFGTSAEYNMTIDLNKINPDISKIRIIASIVSKNDTSNDVPSFDNLSKARFSITDGAGKKYFCDLEKESDSKCHSVDVAIVQRWDKNWRFVEELNFHDGGLELIYGDESYVSELISHRTPFEEIGNIIIIEETWKKTKTTTRFGKTGEKIRTTVTSVLQTCTETFLGEDKSNSKKHIAGRKHYKVETKPNKRRPLVKRSPKAEEPKVETPLMPLLVDKERKVPRNKIVRRMKEDISGNGIKPEQIDSLPTTESHDVESKKPTKRHPIIRRK